MRFCSSCGTALPDSIQRLHPHDTLPLSSESRKPEWDSSPAPGYSSTVPVGLGLSLLSMMLEREDREGHGQAQLGNRRHHLEHDQFWPANNPNDVVEIIPGRALGSESPKEEPDGMDTGRNYCVWLHWVNNSRLREERDREERHRLNWVHDKDAMDAQHSRAEHLEDAESFSL